MTDPFARQLAKKAIETALHTRALITTPPALPKRTYGLCALCGASVRKGPYCHAHSWAG